MPKMKVSKTVKDRFKVTGKGKLLHRRGGVKHRRSKESSGLRARGRKSKELAKSEDRRVRRVLGLPKGKG